METTHNPADPADGPRSLPVDPEGLATAVRLSGVDAKYLQPFDAVDPFNGDLPLRGFLSQKPDHRYGALAITHVDGRPAPQLVLATPKLHYPFGKDGAFHFPPLKRIHMYEKLDGTNVLAYHYSDAAGVRRQSYKLRLSAVLRNSRFGPFLNMFRELLVKHPEATRLADANGCNISMEMYGARNAHLILYETDLALAVLFGIAADGRIVPPHHLKLQGVPAAALLGELAAGHDPVAKYAQMRAEMEQGNKPADNEKLTGTEGLVWYVEEPSARVSMWKCKPESVEEIHWATGINKNAAIATCWNFLETGDDLTYENLLPLLLEEYTPEDVAKFRSNIDSAIQSVRAEFEFRERVFKEYDTLAAQGMSIQKDKGAVMRALSRLFARDEMKKVFSAISTRRTV